MTQEAVLRRLHGEWNSGTEDSVADTARTIADLPRRDLDALVDEVVERIEQRVVDELERRGRRNLPGSF